MLRFVVQHVAALAERLQVSGPVVHRIMIHMRARQEHPCALERLLQTVRGSQAAQRSPFPVSPRAARLVPPAPIPEMVDQAPVGSPAPLTIIPLSRSPTGAPWRAADSECGSAVTLPPRPPCASGRDCGRHHHGPDASAALRAASGAASPFHSKDTRRNE